MKLFFASHNENKVKEIRALLPENMMLKSLNDLLLQDEIEENGLTLEENALIKARALYAQIHHASFADDSGLEVDGLNGRPGVYSARYAGPEKNDAANLRKLLREMEGKNNRSAVFKTVIAFVDGQQEFLFSGEVRGQISIAPRGIHGFGYDPIFIPEGWSQTFAEVEKEVKNGVSHRSRAFDQFIRFLKEQGPTQTNPNLRIQ
jgi:XTP/dITP diphosphohydrolase